MESRIKIAGHPFHPMLIVFPLGLLSTAIAFDIVALVSGNGAWFNISFWMMAAGLLGGVVAALPGFVDWFAIPKNTRAKRIGLLHGCGNVVVLILFAVSWFLRQANAVQPGDVALGFSFAGILLALVTGWLGGELVDRLGVGVDNNANLDAPSSLSGRPAGATPASPVFRSDNPISRAG